jgi:hypothetical protein
MPHAPSRGVKRCTATDPPPPGRAHQVTSWSHGDGGADAPEEEPTAGAGTRSHRTGCRRQLSPPCSHGCTEDVASSASGSASSSQQLPLVP